MCDGDKGMMLSEGKSQRRQRPGIQAVEWGRYCSGAGRMLNYGSIQGKNCVVKSCIYSRTRCCLPDDADVCNKD